MDITKNAVEIFMSENSLISTSIEEVKLNNDEFGELKIQITISGFSKKSKYLKINLLFSEIIEFKFYYSNIYNFYNIENLKLLHINDQIYISFDPDDGDNEKSEDDSDFILAKKLELFSSAGASL
ncbi:hypothetical protein [Chryseobacterium potabilaquae]|uniref:Immunity protein 50 n=1 Tax=Chryseobacterium potabilaquae TaxID=2675057 RepID=A0A6N4X323_9FLAO|nr:hypothetical protein [Chryseobacterium potabilaquae]CAA7195245.1 hypothetical protein CHRY9293_01474 [Chryseobacterium potabilaquae]